MTHHCNAATFEIAALVSLRKNLGQEFAKLPKLSELVIHLILKIFSAIVAVIRMKIAVAMVKREISP